MKPPVRLSNNQTGGIRLPALDDEEEGETMKRIEFLVLAAAATGFLAVPASAQRQADISGRWQLTLPPPPMQGEMRGRGQDQQRRRRASPPQGERPNGPPAVTLVLEQNGEDLKGTVETEQGEARLENGTIKDRTITLTLTMVGPNGEERVLRLQGYVDGDAMVGTLAGGPGGREQRRGGGGGGPGWQAERVNG
jgi:hypothetical protein